MKLGVVDVGGGLRGIYASAVLDYCLDHQIYFDYGIGVSAGSANIASYCAGQARRNIPFYTEYAKRRKYMGIGNFIREKSYINLDYVYGTLSNADGENPLNYQAIIQNPMEYKIVATEARTGKAVYFDKSHLQQDSYDPLKASSCIPLVCKPYTIEGVPYYDGALGDPVPIQKAFDDGCDKVVLLLTKPEGCIRNSEKDEKLAKGIHRKYPYAARKLCQRAHRYNLGVEKAQTYVRAGKALIVAPDHTCGVSTLTRNEEALVQLYEKGYEDGKKIQNFLKSCR